MIIVHPTQPTTRPPVGSGPPLLAGDIWQATVTGLRQRFDGSGWTPFVPAMIYQLPAPTQRPGPPAAPLQIGDIWIHNTSGAQATWDGDRWVAIDRNASELPTGGANEQHLAKSGTRPFESRWVDPAHGIVFLHEQRAAADVWTVVHELRSRWVTVTVVDNTRDPQVTMIPDIEYQNNFCRLFFVEPVRGFAVVHASKPITDHIAI